MGKSTKVGNKRRDDLHKITPLTRKIIKDFMVKVNYKNENELILITELLERRSRKTDRERMGIDTTLGVLRVVKAILEEEEGE